LENRAVCICTGEPLDKLVSDISRLQVGENQGVGASCNFRAGSLALGDAADDGCIKLQLPVYGQGRKFLLEKAGCGDHLVHQLSLCRALGRVGEHGHLRLGVEECPAGECGCFCNFSKLLGCWVGNGCTVGKNERSVCTVLGLVGGHYEAGGSKLDAGFGLDDVESGKQYIAGGVLCSRNHCIGLAQPDHHSPPAKRIDDSLERLFLAHALVLAQLIILLGECLAVITGDGVDDGDALKGCGDGSGRFGNSFGISYENDFFGKLLIDDLACRLNGSQLGSFCEDKMFFCPDGLGLHFFCKRHGSAP